MATAGRFQTFMARNPGDSFRAQKRDGGRRGIQSVSWLQIQPTFMACRPSPNYV